MQILLNQRKLSISDRFDILVDNQSEFTSRRGVFSYKIELYNEKKEVVARVIRKSHTELDASYSIRILDIEEYYFKTVSRKRGIWEVIGEEKLYEIYEHEGFNYSIYRDGIQVGKAVKNDFVLLGGDKFYVDANQDENKLLFITIFLSLDNACFIDRGFRFGYSTKLSKDGKRRDWNWKSDMK